MRDSVSSMKGSVSSDMDLTAPLAESVMSDE